MKAAAPTIRVTIPFELRRLCDGKAELCLAANNVRGLLGALCQEHSQVHSKLCDERGEPRPHINVFVNHDHIRARAGLETPLIDGDVVSILPAVSGG
jgi:MoaD family protein